MMDWPPQTPDLNPIKKIWSKFKKEVGNSYWILNTNTFDGGVEDMEENLYIRKDTL